MEKSMEKIEKLNNLTYNKNIVLENNIELFVYLYSYFSLYDNGEAEKNDFRTIVISATVSSECITFLAQKVKISIDKDTTLPFQEEVMHLEFTPFGGSSYPIRCTINTDMFAETVYVRFEKNERSLIPTMILSCYDQLVLRVDPVPHSS